jgi:hypothetical protein
MEGLISQGLEARLYNEGDAPEILVLSKRYDLDSIKKALELKKNFGTKLYLDICDNHFYYKNPEPAAIKRATELRNAVCAVDVVIASSNYLAEVIGLETGNQTPCVIIGDLVDFPFEPSLIDKIKNPISYFRVKALEFSFRRQKKCNLYRLVWFGNHGGGYADCGMNDLESIRSHLECINSQTPISLTIISNSWRKYINLTKDWAFPTFYLPWNRMFFSSALFLHKTSIVPIKKNPFTMSKTSNRVETSLMHGLSVVADSIPSYLDYKTNIYLGEWVKSLSELVVAENNKKEIDFDGNNFEIIKKWRSVLIGAR